MEEIVGVMLSAGKTAVDMALYTLLPIMVIMMAIMRLLDEWGVLAKIAMLLQPLVKWFGITGLGIFAGLQVLFIGFAGPIASLLMMESRGVSPRHIAASLAFFLPMSQANASFPMVVVGLDIGTTLITSVIGGLVAATVTYYWLANRPEWNQETLSETQLNALPVESEEKRSMMTVLAEGGAEGLKIVWNAIPMLLLALFFVNVLKAVGAIPYISLVLAPIFGLVGLSEASVLPVVTKFIAGGTAFMGVALDQLQTGVMSSVELNRLAGFALNPLDVAGIALYSAVGKRTAMVMKMAVIGGLVGMLVRGVIHFVLY